MSFTVFRYKILEKNTGHWPGDSWKRPALILDRDIAHYVTDEDYEAVKKSGIKRTTLSCMCSQLAQLQVIFAPSSISEEMFWGILAFIGILLEVLVSVFVTGRRD